MYRIGEFSYLYKLTIKTLRYYDEINLFKPSYKEPYTGYRYYSDNQKQELENILKLKDYGFTLEEIKDMKKELNEEQIVRKIEELQRQQEQLNSKIKELESLKNGEENKMKYKVYFDPNIRMNIIGERITINKRTKEELDRYFVDLEKKIRKMFKLDPKKGLHSKVIITEEVGYKEEEVDLFVGYLESIYLNKKQKDIWFKHKENWYSTPPVFDCLVAIDVEEDDVAKACSDIIEYAKENNFQIIGPFIEIYDDIDKLKVYVMVINLKTEEYSTELLKRRSLELYNKPFELSEEFLGKWKIKEILPNINFNPNKQKSNPITTFMNLEFYNDGTTNFENVKWSYNELFIINDNGIISNRMHIKEYDNKEYLEIRMNDLSSVYYNAAPISYIYERELDK